MKALTCFALLGLFASVAQSAPPDSESQTLKGVVKYLNYTRQGEADGAILDSGDYVHLAPHGAEAVKLAVGQRLDIEGEASPMADSHKAVHALKVNGQEIGPGGGPPHEKPPAKKPRPKRKPAPDDF
jgi:hypothetical protein